MILFLEGGAGQPLVNWWFGGRWFGFLGSPHQKGLGFLGVPLES